VLRTDRARLACALLVAATVVGAVGAPAAADCNCWSYHCYEDVTISGLTEYWAKANGVYTVTGMQSGRPIYSGPNGCFIAWVGAPLGWGWQLYIPHPTLGTPHAYYTNPSDAHTPPATGWRSHGDATGVPTLSGGQVCRPPTTITVSPISGNTAENGTTATFTLTPFPAPMHDVTVPLSSSDTSEGTVSASVTLPAGSAGSVTVTVTGVNDDIDDGDIVYSITTGDPTSADAYFNALGAGDVADVSVTNMDDDTRGITVSPTAGLATTEAGGTATLAVVLNSEPTGAVSIGISSDDPSEGTVSPATLTFTSSDWSQPQTVTVTGVDDAVDDGDVAYTIVTGTASGGDYAGLDAPDVGVANTDDDTRGITVSPTAGLTTTEAGGTATFTVVLNSEPTGTVTVGVSSNDVSEGTVSPAALTFTTATWSQPQTVTVTGVDDAVDDGDVAYTIVTGTASGGDYAGLNAADVGVTTTDDDTRGITVSPTAGLTTTEAGGTATFAVVLNSEPTGAVSIGVSSDDPSEGTASPATLTFTTATWSQPQTVTVTGVDDAVDDGDVAYTIVTGTASGGDYAGLDAPDVGVANTDDDTRGITVSPTAGLTTTEAGGTATFAVVLNSEPTGAVSIGISSDDPSEGTVSPAALTFTSSDWSQPQTVTVTGVDDAVDDGDVAYTIVTGTASGGDYAGLNAADVDVTTTDDDTRGITVSPTAGLTTTEAGGTATFAVVLNSEPTGAVSIGVSSDDPSEGTASPAALTFSSANWNRPTIVTVTGVDDDIVDGDISYKIVTAPASGGDYDGLDAADVAVTNIDDEPWIVIVPTGDAGNGEFLDAVLPVTDGEAPPMAGERRLVATCTAGDIISGSCQILGPTRHPTLGGYVHLYLYSVNLSTVPESLWLISHWMADFNCDTWQFEFSCDTRDLSPGCYDLRLSFPDESSETLRIEVMSPV